MRVLVRKAINVDKTPDLDKLSPFQKILVAFIKSYEKTDMYTRKKERMLEQENKLRIQREESLKEEILTSAFMELKHNKTLSRRNLVCKRAELVVDREMQAELEEILKHKEFSTFNIKVINPTNDLGKSYDIPILLQVSEKSLGGETS